MKVYYYKPAKTPNGRWIVNYYFLWIRVGYGVNDQFFKTYETAKIFADKLNLRDRLKK